jgi:hypothetical protein
MDLKLHYLPKQQFEISPKQIYFNGLNFQTPKDVEESGEQILISAHITLKKLL